MKTLLSFLLICCITTATWAQIRRYQRSFQIKPGDVVEAGTLPVSQKPATHILLKPRDYYVLKPRATKDTIPEADLSRLYKDKGCPIEKTLDIKGCVNIKYPDGTKRIVCDKLYEAVITPDGKVHTQRIMVMQSLTFPMTPPALPADQAILSWLKNYNDALLQNLLNYASAADQPMLKSEILKKEKVMKLDIYGQVVNRVNLLEQFADIR